MLKLLFFMAPYLNRFNLMQTIFFVCLLAALLIRGTGSLLSHDDECFALYQFKQNILHRDYASLGSPGHQKFDSWKITNNASDSGSDCCLWDGVVCGNKENDGHVIGLDLSKSFLYGPINSSSTLFNLVHLQVLKLSKNNFIESQIPSRIANLKQLRILDLSDAGFSGQIPNEISQLVQLSSLDLSRNPLKLESPSLDDLVKNLTRLEELHLSEVDISSSVPHFLANFSSLRSIKLSYCFLQNEFPTAILELPKLEFLDVTYNTNLTGSFSEFRNNSLLEHLDLAYTGFFGIVPESISNLNHLTFLRLTQCFFTGKIPGSLPNMTQLVALGLGDIEFTGVVPSLVSLLELNILELSGNKFEKGCFPEWLGKLSKLNELYVAEMSRLHDEIPPFLENLTKLTVLDMTTNSLFGRIPSWFFNLTQLTRVSLQGNQLYGPISNSFSNFKSLQTVGLHRNNFSGRVELDMFLGLEKLVDLSVGGNKISFVPTHNYTNGTLPELETINLSSCNLKEYPAFLRFQNKMVHILLRDNNIDGLLPEWTWNRNQETLEMLDLAGNFINGFHQHQHVLPWVRLIFLSIEYNQLQGQLPIPPPTTKYYSVSNNNLRGEVPTLICEVKSLQVLDLSSNNMTGTLPPCFGSLSNSLAVLNLHKNNFQGTMMNTFTRGSPLKMIDLSENQFVGQVSKSLTNCTNLEVLSLGDNSFRDVFPSWLGTLFELQVLILRSNKFSGAIQGPTNVSSQFPKLRIIDLSNNGFSGQLPDKYFQTWNAMKSADVGKSYVMESMISIDDYKTNVSYSMTIINKGVKREYQKILKVFTAIDLSSNNFEGEMPQALQDLLGLESLNLSNNHLTGHILSSLGNLKNLESLDLSQNKLSGEIPQQLLQLDFLSIFNVSFNYLDGHIPQANHFDTFDNSSYMGNLGLCGKPLFKECPNSKTSTASETSNKAESFLPSERVDWIVIFFGFGSGLVVGIVIGNFLYARYSDCLIERFGMRNGKWIRPLSNMRKN